MPMNSPGTILKMWNKTVTKLDDGKKPADLPKKGNEQKLKIKNSLTALKFEAPNSKNNPDAFIAKRDKSALLLRRFCRYLKAAKDEDKKITQKFLKTVMGLAVVVAKLEPGNIDLSEEEGSLESLDAQDTSALASALEKPDTEPEVGDAPMPQDVVPGATAPAPDAQGAKFKARLAELKKQFDQVKAADPARAQPLAGLLMQAASLGQTQQFADAMLRLDAFEEQLKKVVPGKPAADTTKPASAMERFNALTPAIKAALGSGGPNVARIQTLVGAASGLLKNKDMVQANKVLDELEPLLKPAAGAAAADSGAEFKKKLAEWTPAIKAALTAKGPNAAAIANLLAQATAQSKPGGDMAQALAKLTECHSLATATGQPADGAVAAEIAKPAVVARLAGQTGKVAAVARPTARPKRALTNDLVADIASKAPPARIEDMPNFVAQFVPKFLMTSVSELSQGSQPLAAGAALPAQDQMLGLADLFGAAQLSLEAWEKLLKEGEAAQAQLDQMEKAKGQRDEKAEAEYVVTLERYNAIRTRGLAEQTRTLKKVQGLSAEYKGLQAAKA